MRTIKFRGKRESGQWIYGSLLMWPSGHAMIYDTMLRDGSIGGHAVITSTIGQFCGLNDIYGNDVYEGDIVRLAGEQDYRVVVYYEEAFNIATANEMDYLRKGEHPYIDDYAHMTCLNEWSNTGLVRVVGNIHDNPELLTKTTD